MGDKASRRGAANLGMPLMIVAFLAMAGFLYWLNLQAQADAAERAVQEDVPEDTSSDVSGVLVPGEDLQGDPSPYDGMVVTVQGLSVASRLGTQGFWLELPNKNPFLVSMSEAVKAEGITVNTGQTVTVSGTIYAMGDSVLDAWSKAGSIGEGDRLAAEFATHFLEAQQVRVRDGTGTGGGEG
jgi:hypothetical protein